MSKQSAQRFYLLRGRFLLRPGGVNVGSVISPVALASGLLGRHVLRRFQDVAIDRHSDFTQLTLSRKAGNQTGERRINVFKIAVPVRHVIVAIDDCGNVGANTYFEPRRRQQSFDRGASRD